MTTRTAYAEALQWLFARTRSGRERSPEHMLSLMSALNLARPPRVAHVVGTNGKGTVSSMIAEGMQATGQTVGLFVSPHVEDYRERISVNGELIAEHEVTEFVEQVRSGNTGNDNHAFFELTLALALAHFERRSVDFVALEAGVGARHDATMAVGNTVLTVVSSIALDHTETLGASVRTITADKAAAIRPGIPAVTAVTGEALEVLQETAASGGSPLFHPAGNEELFSLPAEDQATGARLANQRLAAAALRLLGADEAAVTRGISRPALPGRAETFIVRDTRVLLDGAHDPAAAAVLVSGLEQGYTLLYGGLGRKNRLGTAEVLAAKAGQVISTSVPPDDPLDWPSARINADPEQALEEALRVTPEGGLVLIAGSLYLAGRLRPLLRELTRA